MTDLDTTPCRFFLNTQLSISIYMKIHSMVITTHMYNQMIQEDRKKTEKEKVPNNPESTLIKSFLKDSSSFEKAEKSVISSNS